MKRIQDDWDLRKAFSPAPEDVKNMLIRTANSVKEEEKVKRYSWKPVLIAAAIMVVTMSVGLAASGLVGWTDFFSHFYDIGLPQQAQEIMAQTEHQSFQVGPLTLTVQELLCDGENAFTSISARTTDGSNAVISSYGEWAMPIYANGMENEAQRLGVDSMMSWELAAKTLDLPLYAVRAIPEVDYSLMDGEQMEDYLHDAEGAFVNFSMVPLRADKIGDALPVTYYLHVAEVEPGTGNVKQEWTERVDSTIPVVSSVLAEKTYIPDDECLVNGYRLESILIEMRVTGGYVTAIFTAPEGLSEQPWYDVYDAMILADGDGNPFRSGISLTVSGDSSDWPRVVIWQTISISELPESVQVLTRDEAETGEPQQFEVTLSGN